MKTLTAISPRTRLADDQLAKLNKSNCRLSVYLSARRIAWSILDTVHHKVVSVIDCPLRKEHYEFIWEEAISCLETNEKALHSFGGVTVAFDGGRSGLIPEALFEESEIATYIQFGIPTPGNPVKDYIKKLPAYNVYDIPNGLLESLRKVFEKFELLHVSTPFIENILSENKNAHDSKIFASILDDNLHLAALDEGKFAYYNSFSITAKEDFAYYVMAMAEELNFHPEQIQISLSGDITPDSAYYQTAKRFVSKLTFSDRPKALKYSAQLDNVPRHLFALLYSIHLCE